MAKRIASKASDLSDSAVAVAKCLVIDRTAAEVVAAMQRAEIPCLLLKGATFAHWLYSDSEIRPYEDADLLIAPECEEAAEMLLRELGFVANVGTGVIEPNGVARHHIWRRDGIHVELHVTLVGINAPPAEVWAAFCEHQQPEELNGTTVMTPGEAACTLHVALHAAQHGRDALRPLEDLDRALERVSVEYWEQAAVLAARLDAIAAFSTGLRLRPAGRVRAAELALPNVVPVDVALRAQSAPDLALGINRLVSAPGLRGKIKHALRGAFPSRGLMRWRFALARRGTAGLILAYLRWPLWLVVHLPAATRAWIDAARQDQPR